MSTAKVVTVVHPSATVNNIVNDASGNVAIGGALTVAGVAAVAVAPSTSGNVLTSTGSAWQSTNIFPAGFLFTSYSNGTISSGTLTPSAANANYQYYTNNGAHTLAAPTSDCAIDILLTNGASAGSVTFSGFTVGSSTGSAYVTTNASKFIISIRRINAVSTYSIYALQ